MTPLEGKVALVTGGSRGMGAAIARRLAAQGASVALTYRRSADAAEAVVADLKGSGADAIAIRADHRDDAGSLGACAAAIRHFGRIDILVNCAGVFVYAPIGETSPQDIDDVLALHVRAPYRLIQAALPAMRQGGRIITIGSSLGTRVPGPSLSLYAMSKAAMVGLTRALARELGPREITVNLVNPGSVDTDMNPADGPQADAERSLIPLGRYGRAGEIADSVAFLAGPSGAFVNGAVLAIDGGATA